MFKRAIDDNKQLGERSLEIDDNNDTIIDHYVNNGNGNISER